MIPRAPSLFCCCIVPALCLAVLAAALCLPRTFIKASELTPGFTPPTALPLERDTPGRWRLPVTLYPLTGGDRLRAVELYFSTSRYALRLDNAVLEFEGTSCRLETGPRLLWDRSPLRFLPTDNACAGLPPGEVLTGTLRMKLLDHGSASLLVTRDVLTESFLQTKDGYASLGLWLWQPEPARATRLRLLAAMWDTPHGGWILGILAAAAGLSSLGLALRAGRPALACGLCSLALGMAYAVVTPPFQAPDEPDHFLSWTRLTDNPALETDAHRLAQVGHFQRLKHNPFETFGPWDIGAPFPVPWEVEDDDGIELVGDSMMETRSALTTAFWSGIRPLIAMDSAARAVLGIRLANAVCYALAVWAGAALLFSLTGRQAWPWFLFLVPAAPFFAMHVSNYAQFMSASVLLACAGLAVLLREDGGRQLLLGCWLGAGAALLVLSASTGVAAGAFVLGMAVAGVPGRGQTPGGAWRFWAGLGLGASLLGLGTGSDQMAQLLRVGGRLAGMAGPAPWWTPLLVIWVGCGAACGLEWLVRYLPGMPAGLARWGRCGAGLLAVVGAILCVYSGFQQYRMQPCMPPPGGEPRFWLDILHGLPTLLSFREPDLLLSRTFWGGFGWHDALLPPRVVQVLAGLAGMGVVLLGWKASRQRQGALGWRLCGWLAGSWGFIVATGLAAAAAGQERALPNVHGRYLLAGYCALLAGVFAGWSVTVGTGRRPQAVLPGSPAGVRLLTGWLLTGIALVLVLGVMRFSLPHVFNWLPVDGLHLAMAAGFPLLGWWWLRGSVTPGGATCAGPSCRTVLAGAAVLGLGVLYAELGYGLPWVFVRYPYGFFVVLGLAGLVWLAATLRAVTLEPAPATPRHWPSAVACVAAHVLHTGTLVFLLVRYMG